MSSTYLAAFTTSASLVRAIEQARSQGLAVLDAFSPYPDEALEQALLPGRSKIGWIMLAGGVGGGVAAYLLQWWTNVVDLPQIVGGIPPHAPLAFVPIVFETTVLGAALGGVAALFYLLGLPAFWHPVHEVDVFRRASVDTFFLLARGDAARVPQILRELGATHVDAVTS